MRPSKRDKVLSAALQVAQREGVSAVTLEATAAEAGISKGGLLYHFPSKEHLLSGLVRYILDGWEAEMRADLGMPPEEADVTRRLESYVRVTADEETGCLADVATLVASVHDEQLSRHYREMIARWIPAESLTPRQTIARLAADGLWLADATATVRLNPRDRAEALAEMLDMVRGDDRAA